MIGLFSVIEPATIDEALSDDGWILDMQEELIQLQRNYVWDLEPKPQQKNIIGTKWVVRNNLNEQGEVIRNKARFVAQGYSQQEGIDYTKTFATVARLEEIRLFLSYAVNHDIILYQMDVNSAFLMESYKKKCLSSNLLVLRILSILTMFINLRNHYMA